MSDEQFYSEIETQIPCELIFGKIIRSPYKSGILKKISLSDDSMSDGDVQIFPFSEIFGEETHIRYEGEGVALAVGRDKQLLSELSFQFAIEDDSSENAETQFATQKKTRTNVTAQSEEEFKNLFDTAHLVTQETWTSEIDTLSCTETEGAAAYFAEGNLTVFSPLKDTENVLGKIHDTTRLESGRISFVKTISHEKNTNANYYCALCAVLASFAATKTGKAVIVSLSREEQEEFVENPLTVTAKITTAFNEENKLLAATVEVSANLGAFCQFAQTFLDEALKKSLGFYAPTFYSISAEAKFARSRPRAIDFSMLDAQLFFGIECHFNKIADISGDSPKTLRLKNISSELAEKDKITDGMKKSCGLLDDCVKIKLEEFEVNDLTKFEKTLVNDFDFSPSVFDRKWSSYRLTNKKKSLLYKNSNLRGTGLSFCFKESNAENFSGTAFAFCTLEIEINPLTYKEEITEIRLFVNGGKLLNQERAVSTVKAAIQRMVKIMMNDNCANCENIVIRFLKSNDEAKKIGDLVHYVLPSAFISAISQALDCTVTDFPIGSRKIFDILEGKS